MYLKIFREKERGQSRIDNPETLATLGIQHGTKRTTQR
jgi:hypothetical protein